ncbi:hypothetical protein GY12_19885 [Micrococcus luteus]|nr:hypothetical protein GY12_19885 [Micrococcus luteus]
MTAMVSPSARPRPSMIEETMPARANGNTVILIISQRVAPRPSAASSWSFGVWVKISRQSAVMIGRTITASTTPEVSRVRPVVVAEPPKNGMKPRFSLSQP